MTKNLLACRRERFDEQTILEGRKLIAEKSDLLQEVARFNATMGRDARLKILFLLTQFDELCPCDLSDILGNAIQSISDHLSRLRTWGVVNTRREGRTIYYSLKPKWKRFFKNFFAMMEEMSAQKTI